MRTEPFHPFPRFHSLPLDRSTPTEGLAFIAAVVTTGILLVWVDAAESDQAASLGAAAAFGICLLLCLRLLRLDPLSPVMVYLYVFAVFHLGLVVPWGLGLERETLPGWVLSNPLTPALSLVILAFMAYAAGSALAVWKWPPAEHAAAPPRRYYNMVIYHFGWVIFTGACAMFLWGIRALGFERLLAATYFEVYKLTNWYDPRFFVTSLNVAPIGLYLMAAAAPWRKLALVITMVASWSGMIFWLGFRGFGLIPVITVLAVLKKRGFRLPRTAYVIGLGVVLLAIPMVTAMRDAPLGERSVSKALSTARPLAAVQEMGASLRPLVHTVHYMETESFRWGQTYWRGLLAAFPNLSLDWQGRSYVPLEELPPSHWVTRQATPWTYRHFGGLGFSAVAEPYMNFGTLGVAIYFLLLPVFLIWVGRYDASQPTRLAAWAVLLGPLLWTTRNSFGNFFRPALVGLACVMLARLASNSLAPMWARRRGGKDSRPAPATSSRSAAA